MPFVLIGLLAVPIGLVASGFTALLQDLPYAGRALDVATNRGSDDIGSRLLMASGIGASLWPVTVLVVSAAVAHLVSRDEPVTTHADGPVDAPHGDVDADVVERACPGDGVVVAGVEQRPVDVEHHGDGSVLVSAVLVSHGPAVPRVTSVHAGAGGATTVTLRGTGRS